MPSKKSTTKERYGMIPRSETRYYKECLQPLIDGQQIQTRRRTQACRQEELRQGASALLFPIDLPEPFGLVMIEGMACGTPVISFRRGSVPEVIDNGITGFIVDNEDEAISAIKRIGELDRQRVRATFGRRFTARRMTQDYLDLYQSLLRMETARALEPITMLNTCHRPEATPQRPSASVR